MPELHPGLRGEVSAMVDEGRTAAAFGSGDVPVLGTPAALALAEAAACSAVEGRLGEGRTSVGTRVELEHLAPTPLGASVTARATLVAVDGRTLDFRFELVDPAGPVARGRHRRVVVDRAEFLDAATARGAD